MDLRASLQVVADRLNAARDDRVAFLEDSDEAARFARIEATIDPTKLTLPGILVQLAGVDVDTLAGETVQVRILIVAPQRDDPRTLDHLTRGLQIAYDADLEVTGPAAATGVRVPAQPKPMPGLTVPAQIHESD